MPSINMIAARRAEKRRQEQNIRKLVYGIIAEIGVVVAATGALGTTFVRLNNQSADLSGQIRKLQPKVNEIQKLQQDAGRLQPKVETLDGAKADTLFWYSNLYAITNSLPPKTWLTSLGTGGAGGGGRPGSRRRNATRPSTWPASPLNQAHGRRHHAAHEPVAPPGPHRSGLRAAAEDRRHRHRLVPDDRASQAGAAAAPAAAPAQGGASNVQKS